MGLIVVITSYRPYKICFLKKIEILSLILDHIDYRKEQRVGGQKGHVFLPELPVSSFLTRRFCMGYFLGTASKLAIIPQSIFIGSQIQYLFGSKNELEYNHLLFRRKMLHRFSSPSFFFSFL